MPPDGGLLHPRCHLPAHCFAYVRSVNDAKTWHLPYRLADGCIDQRRLPKAIQVLLSNYRGARTRSVPDEVAAEVLFRLAEAACEEGLMPFQQGSGAADCYQLLEVALRQSGQLDELRVRRPDPSLTEAEAS